MRPRHFCRGNVTLLRHTTLTRGSFNEASAFLPRKPDWLHERVCYAQRASMRPRHFCRGNRAAEAGDRVALFLLQ